MVDAMMPGAYNDIDFSDISDLDLPAGVREMIEFMPFEDMLLSLFRRGLPSIKMHTLIPPSDFLEFPFVLARRMQPVGFWNGDPRFLDKGRVAVSVFAEDPNGENKAILISEAIRVMFAKATKERWKFPGISSIVNIRMLQEPNRVADWATATGPVQFADLPGNVWRAEALYDFTVRRPDRKNRKES